MPRDDLIVARAERLCLLYAAHKARQQHRATTTIMRRLRRTTARVASLEAQGPHKQEQPQ